MSATNRLTGTLRDGGPALWLAVAAFAALAFAYASLFTLGTRYGFEKGVEYWLFRPTDNAPLVILVLAGWLGYRRFYRLRALAPATAPLPLIGACTAGAVALHAWAVYTRADDLQFVSLALALSAVILAWRGTAGLRAVWLPIVFLLFAIPMPAPLMLAVVFELQLWTAQFAGWLLYVLGVPSLVSGDQIVRATQTFQVIEGCSGMRSIETLTMLSVLMIDLFGRRGWHALALLLAAPCVAFALNGVRVLTLILNPHSEIIAIHNLQGIAILLVGLLLIYGLDVMIERAAGEHVPEAWRPPAAAPARAFSPAIAHGTVWLAALAMSTSRIAVPVWEDPHPAPRLLHEVVGDALAGWPSEGITPDFNFQGSSRFGEVFHRRYELEGAPVGVFVGTADLGQRGGSPLSQTTAVPGSGWLVRESGPANVADRRGTITVRVLDKGKQRLLVHHWYVGDRGLTGEVARSLLATDRSPLRRDDLLYVVRLETAILGHAESDRRASEARLASIEAALVPALEQLEGRYESVVRATD